MKLLTKEIANKLPPLYSQENKGTDAIVYVKFFDPTSQWTWFATEANAVLKDGRETSLKEAFEHPDDIADVMFFGFVIGVEKELGYFNLTELKSWRGTLNLGIERDLHFTPKPLKEIKGWE